MDLIHLWVCLVFSFRGKRSWTHCQIMLSDYVLQNRPKMQCRACLLILSVYFFVSLSYTHTHATHCKIFLWSLAAPPLESLHNTLESTHQTLVLWVLVYHFPILYNHERGSSVLQIPFMLSENSVTMQPANMPLQEQIAFKLVGFVWRICVSIQIDWGYLGSDLQLH